MSRLRRRHRRERGALDFTSLVDVALVLVVFFLLSAQAGGLRSLPVVLPQAGSATTERVASLELLIDRGGALTAQGRRLELAELAGVIGHAGRIVIAADAEARHGRVVEVVDALRRAGAREIYFATAPAVQDW